MALPAAAQTFVTDAQLDLRREICPMTYVRTRLALDRLRTGQILAVTLASDDSLRNVPLSAERQGHTVLARIAGDGGTTVVIRRK